MRNSENMPHQHWEEIFSSHILWIRC